MTGRVRGIQGIETLIEILSEVDGGYDARVTSTTVTGTRESFEFIGDDLLESCVKTGYLEAIQTPALAEVLSA